jgi:hypothetical protein
MDSETTRLRALFIAVAVLGVASFALSFGPVVNDGGATGWNVRFAALAALCAAFGLLPRQKPVPLVTAVLAVMGFLDGLASAVAVTQSGWAMTAIVVSNALQAAAAVAALLRAPSSAPDSAAAGYEAYVDYYNQAVRSYYAHQAGSAPHEQSEHGGYGEAYAGAQATAQTHRAERPSQQADYSELDYTRSPGSTAYEHDSGATPGRHAGMPSFGQAPTYADQHRRDIGETRPPASSV